MKISENRSIRGTHCPVTLVRMRPHILATSALFLAAACPFVSAQTSPVASRLATQNALFDESWQASLKMSPTLATSVGDYRYNDQLGDYSLAAIAARHQREVSDLARIKTIDPTGFPEQDLISHDLFLRQLQQRVEDFDLKEFEMPLSASGGGGGIHASLADLPLSMPFDSVKHYEDYLSRLRQIPKAFLQVEDVLRAGVKDHLLPVRFTAEKIPGQAEGVIAANPFLIPLRKFPASFSDAEKKRLTDEITSTVNSEVFPAYKQFAAFVTKDYIPYTRTTLSINSLGGGKRRYQATLRRFTTTDLTAAQIHEIGLKEVDRINGEMAALAKANGYSDLASFRNHIENDPKYQAVSADAIVEDFRKYIAQMQPHLPELFNLLPKTAVTVEPIPPFQASAATHYQGGTPDGKRPGRVSVAVSDPTHRSYINDEAIAYHEGVPGHHLQISIQQSLTGLPEFRKHGGNSAYTEGWGLYAEELGKEIGFYQDPGSDYGRLRSELFRAVRLVVDTGIHDMGWSRDQVVEYMRNSHAIDEPTIQSETDRYISGPGQACSYKLGQLKIRELRERSKLQLGPKFDLKTFHDEVLSGGALPLDVLDARIDRWIKGQLPTTASN
ncbi:DUF885 domain-containing protein [Terriglobus saanensis]|uniref:Lipoprotein n=1 Tax=Terriglobus saanensis (strain ATCC BAA-1853 / DSM 23119 / SP1PR4) TaxID=401053 RepID=E8V8C8_TERSS|nr:DUF885 domain-containing protein [Terriglobus saanensis]ADV81831.1 protein of unknown function DUF885 [Terriglobus saanensis SP1PR4]